jgi:hypothetical protein
MRIDQPLGARDVAPATLPGPGSLPFTLAVNGEARCAAVANAVFNATDRRIRALPPATELVMDTA